MRALIAVSTHRPRAFQARLTQFRLAAAERRRDAAIKEAEHRYRAEVRVILSNDRSATDAQRQLERANDFPWPFRRGGMGTSPHPALTFPDAGVPHALDALDPDHWLDPVALFSGARRA